MGWLAACKVRGKRQTTGSHPPEALGTKGTNRYSPSTSVILKRIFLWRNRKKLKANLDANGKRQLPLWPLLRPPLFQNYCYNHHQYTLPRVKLVRSIEIPAHLGKVHFIPHILHPVSPVKKHSEYPHYLNDRNTSAVAMEKRRDPKQTALQSREDVCRNSPAQTERAKSYGNRIREIKYLLSKYEVTSPRRSVFWLLFVQGWGLDKRGVGLRSQLNHIICRPL